MGDPAPAPAPAPAPPPRRFGLPAGVASIVPVQAIVLPSAGWAQLTWFEDRLVPKSAGRVILRFSAPPWHQTGVQPFAWQWVKATGKSMMPVLLVAVARNVTLTQASVRPGFPERPMHLGASPEGAGFIPGFPIILLYRPQDDGLVPDPEEAFDPHSLVGEPYVVAPEGLPQAWEEVQTHHVRPYETGVVVAQHHGGYEVHVRLTDLGRPSAFAYEIIPGQTQLTSIIRIVHTAGVEVRVRAREEWKQAIRILTCQVSRVELVPPQGAELGEDRFRFEYHFIDKIIPTRQTLLLISLFEIAINLIPYVGVIYDIGVFAYSAATGKNFWGYDVDQTDILLMGFTAALPLGVGAASTLNRLRSVVRATQLEQVLQAEVLAEIRRVADTGFVEAVGTLSPRQVDRLTASLERHLADPRSMPLQALVSQLDQAISEAYQLTLERRLRARVFKEDFSGFRHPQLNAAYNKYKSGSRFRRSPELAKDPASWAKRQSAATAGAPRALLRQVLGDDFVEVINRALKNKSVSRQVAKIDIDNYDKLVARGVEDYGTLRNQASKLPGFGDLFEIDHLLEQRFWRNNPNLVTAFDEKGLGMAFVVPKNAAVSRSMFVGFGGKRIRYVHTVKTRMVRQLIPNGTEALFSVQEVWDAHVHVLKSLGADPSLYVGRLAQDFELMANELGEQFAARVPSPDIFLRENGWPLAFQDPDGSWSVIRTR